MNHTPQGLIDIREVLQYLDRDRYMSKAAAAEYLSVSVRTLETRKDIPRFQLKGQGGRGGKVRFKKSELDRWMETHRVNDDQAPELARFADDAVRAVFRKN